MIQLSHSTAKIKGKINISGSKSESNRWLILQKLFPEITEIKNISNSEDTKLLAEALHNCQLSTANCLLNIGHAGTAMRFLTAYFATTDNANVILTGSKRMQERPIYPLVNALRDLGCVINYVEKEGFPPLQIFGKSITKDEVNIPANVSSQYITALMLIAAKLPNGLKINFTTELTSQPYIEMTKNQLQSIGIMVNWLENGIQIYPKKRVDKQSVTVESDWSSASYWYSMAALSKCAEIELKFFKKNSWQGDAELVNIYEKFFGVKTIFQSDSIILSKIDGFVFPDCIELDLNKTPDIAQTIAVTCAALKIKTKLTGLHTLKIKETDRLAALQTELEKLGATVQISNDDLELISFSEITSMPTIATYQDHRMAMSFAPLALKFPVQIEDDKVVKKSYPNFWQDLEKVGFTIRR